MPLSVGELLAYLKLDSAGFDAGIAKAREGMAGATGSAEKMAGAVGMTETALANAGRQAGVASSGTARFRAAQLSAVAATERYNLVLADENATVRQLALAEAALIRANQAVKASTPVASISATGTAATATATKMTGLRVSMGTAFGTAKSLGLMFGAFEAVKKAIDVGKEAAAFQRSMLLIRTNANASAAEVKNMTAAVLTLSPEVAAKPSDLADALYHVEQNGLRGAQALKALKIGAMGAKIGFADVEDTTNTMTIAIASGMRGVNDMQKAMGGMIAIAGTGDMRLSQLNEALGTGILSVAKGFGASMQDVGAVLATLGDNGIRGANAATGLRQVMMGFAKPAAEGAAALAKVGLTMHSLGDEMTKHGLVAAMNLLNDRMQAAGITGNQVGAFITQAFGRKAGASLGVLVGEMDRVNTKFDEFGKGAASFGDKWTATTQTASFAFQKLGAEVEVAGIKIATKVIPAATQAATWLGTNVPHAISVLAQILGPTVTLIGDGLGGAWKVVSAALQVAAGVLGSVGHFLQEHKALATGAATAILGLWAAFKLAAVATAGLRLLGPMLLGLGIRARTAGVGVASAATNIRSMSAASAAGSLALAGLTVALGVAVMVWQQHEQVVAENKAIVEGFSQALDADSQAIGRHVRAQAEQNLVTDQAYATAKKYGVSQRELTDAATAQGPVFAHLRDQIIATAKAHGAEGYELLSLQAALGKTHTLLGQAIGDNKDVAASEGKSANATLAHKAATQADTDVVQYSINAKGQLVATEVKSGSALDNTSAAMQRQTVASGLLKNAIDALNGVNESVEQTTDSLNVSLGNLRSGMSLVKDKNGDVVTSLRQSTVAGATNRQMLVGIIDQAKAAAQAVADHARQQGATLPNALAKGNAALKANEDRIRAAASAAGLDKGLVDALIASVGQLAKIHANPSINLDTSTPTARLHALIALMNQVNAMHPNVHYGVTGGNTGQSATGNASGGGLPEGVSAVGERGAELAIKNGSNVRILSNGQSRSFLAATGMRAPGFASGTTPDPAIAKAYGNAQSAISGIQVSILAPTPTALRQFLGAADAAAKKITAAAAAGVSPKKLAQLRADLADMVKTANEQLGNLRVQINHADMASLTRSLSGSASDVRSAWQGVVSDLRDAGMGRGAISALTATERNLASQVGRRDRLRDALAAARQARAEERSTVSGAVRGFFNVTSAGASPVSGAVSFGSFRAQQVQAKNQILKWAAGIRKLRKMFGKSKIGIEYLRSLAEDGPSTLPQVEALLSGGAAGLHAVIDTQRTIDKTAASIGGLVGGAVDQPRIDKLKDALDNQNKVIDKLDGKIEKGIRDGLHGLRIEIDPRGVARLVTTGNNKNARRK